MANMPDNKGRSRGETLERLKTGKPGRRIVVSNMSYCRFRNTLLDMQDCEENWEDADLSSEEERARNQLLKVCQSIVDDYGEQLHS